MMQCPLCQDQALEPHFRLGIEIDVCPRCKGVWLDRGELDRLATEPPARGATPPPPPATSSAPLTGVGAPRSFDDRQDTVRDGRDRRDDRDDRDDRGSSKPKKKKKKSKRLSDALEDLFDDILDF